MGDQNTSATPPAASGGLTKEDVKAIFAEGIKEVLGESLKPIHEQMGKLQIAITPPAASAAAKGKEGESKPLTADDVKSILAEGLKGFQSQQSQSQARQDFMRSKLNDLPPTYQNLLPDTGDAAALAKAEQDIRARYKSEVLAKIGTQGATAAGSDAGGSAVAPKVDLSKLSPVQKIELAMGKKGQGDVAGATAGAAAGGAAAS